MQGKKIVLFLLSLWICAFTVGALSAQVLVEPYEGPLDRQQLQILKNLKAKPTTKRVRTVSLNTKVFKGKKLIANLFPDYVQEIDYFDIGYTGIKTPSWVGHFPERLGSATFLLNGDRISAHIVSVDGNFEIAPLGNDGVHMIFEHDSRMFEGCDVEISKYPVKKHGQHKSHQDPGHSSDDPKKEAKTPNGTPEMSGNECLIRAIIAYTDDTETATMNVYGRTMIEHIELTILDTNTGHANSNVEQRTELAYLYETNYDESENADTDKNRLQDDNDGFMDEIHTHRDNYDGDYCSLITSGTLDGLCGSAYGFDYTDPDNMFQVSEYDCIVGNFTWAHENGHCQGLRHDNDNTSSPFDYAKGYNEGTNFRTIMAVCCSPQRVNYWSNPDIISPFGGGAMGVEDENDCARALDVGDFTVAHHRETPTSFITVINLPGDHWLNMFTSNLLNSENNALDGSKLELKAYTKVVLQDGFKAFEGSFARAFIIGPCPEVSYRDEVDQGEEVLTYEAAGVHLAAFPNPAKGSATLVYMLPEQGEATLSIFNSLGERMISHWEEDAVAGSHQLQLDVSNWPSGMYYCVLEYKGQQQKLSLVVIE